MIHTNSILFFHINQKEIISNSDIIMKLKETTFSDEIGIGFKEISLESDDYLIGIAEKNTPVFFNVLDTETQKIIKKEEIIVSEIEFAIDFKYKIVEVFGKLSDAKKLKTIFKEVFGDTFFFETININISEVIDKIDKELIRLEIKKITITNFIHKVGLLGTYDATVYNNDIAWELIKNNSKNIAKIVIVGNIENDNDLLITIDSLSKIKIKSKNQSNTGQFFNIFKKALTS